MAETHGVVVIWNGRDITNEVEFNTAGQVVLPGAGTFTVAYDLTVGSEVSVTDQIIDRCARELLKHYEETQ